MKRKKQDKAAGQAPRCTRHGKNYVPSCNDCRAILAAIEEGVYGHGSKGGAA